jgi:NADH-quinone oxidoreductase subunit L
MVAIVGALTAIFSASIGLAQNDIKRVLAYSTISQLGYMFLACGVGAFSAGIFHLMTHAFFKALLFLGAGSVIHGLTGEQDLRKMGGLRTHLPITFPTFFIATLAIAGFPLLSGFFSKDEILWEAFSSSHGHWIYWLIGVVAAGMTSFYMFRLVFLAFFGPSRVEPEKIHHIHESPPSMTIPLIILALLSIIGGFVGIPHILGGANRFHSFLAPVFSGHNGGGHMGNPSALTEMLVMIVSVLVAFGGFYLAYRMYIKRPELPSILADKARGVYQLIFNKYYVDEIYDFLFVNPIKNGANRVWQLFDVLVVDGSVNGIANLASQGSGLLSQFQSGYVKSYAASILIGADLGHGSGVSSFLLRPIAECFYF